MNTKTLFATDDPDFISFQYGAPGKDLMPTRVMAEASAALFAVEGNYTYLQYGPTLGSAEYLTELAKFLCAEYAVSDLSGFKQSEVNPSNLGLTAGASASFSNIITLFTTPQTKILIENPTYFLALKVLEDHGFDPSAFVNISSDVAEGLDMNALEAYLSSQNAPVEPRAAFKYTYLLYCVPTYSNPTGSTISLERRKRLVELARAYDILVVCDDVYQLLHFSTTPPPPRLVALDLADSPSRAHVIANNSWSKIMAPGLRLGWIECHASLLAHLSASGIMNSGGSPNHIVSGIIVVGLQQGGVQRHLGMLRGEYATRMQIVCDALEAGLPSGASFRRPDGGFFVWVQLPEGHDAFEIQSAVQKGTSYRGKELTPVKMSFAPGRLFSTDNASVGHCLRLTFAFYSQAKLLEGVERLCALLHEAL